MGFVAFIFWVSSLFIIYTYLLYPLFLILLYKSKPFHPSTNTTFLPNVSIVIAAYNEDKVIEERVKNCLALDYPKEQLEIIIASDGSDDNTNEIVRKYSGFAVKLFDYKERRGKVNVLNETVPQALGDVIVFSDANTCFENDALRKLVRHFHDPKIGCVCGLLRFINAEGSNTAELEGVYWKFETLLKKIEGSRGALLGANGAIFAIRKDLFVHCPPNTIVEDFVMPMKILERGYKVVYEPEAVAIEEAAKHIIHEKQRRIRIGAGDYQALTLLVPMLNPLRGFPALAFWSHKVIRWCVPFFMVSAFVANLFLLNELFYRLTFFIQCAFYICAFIGQILSFSDVQRKPFSICYYFVSMNLALLLGFFRFLTKTQKVAWHRTER